MNILKKSFTSLLFVVFALFVPLALTPLPVGAQSCELDSDSFLGIPAWYKYLETTNDDSGRCSPQVDGLDSLLPIGLAVLEALIRLAGLVAVIMIFFAGFKFITSQGNPDAAAAARKTAINALIGLVIVVLATSIISFIGNSLL